MKRNTDRKPSIFMGVVIVVVISIGSMILLMWCSSSAWTETMGILDALLSDTQTASAVTDCVTDVRIRLTRYAVLAMAVSLGSLAPFLAHCLTVVRQWEEAFRRLEEERRKTKQALDAARAASASKSVFLSNMSHDIRTPMNAIVGLSTMLVRDAEDPERVRTDVKKIVASSQHLLSLINDVLDMSKIEAGKTTLNVDELNLAELVEEIGTMLRPQTNAKEQDFRIILDQLRNERVIGDKLRINQILINLLSNASKYTPPGGKIRLRITQLPQQEKGYACFRFEVEDNGYGMSEAYQKVLFDPFTREESGVANKAQGTGLGMTITKNLVDLMGGTISVKSRLNEGTLFTLELQLQEVRIDPDFWVDHGVRRMLVVDNEPEVCARVADTMADTGVEVRQAHSGHDAIDMIKEDYDLILLDMKMPDMNGLETAREIRKVVPGHVPIMILTAYDWAVIKDEALAAGIDGFMPKPFFLSNFKATLERLKNQSVETFCPVEDSEVLQGRHFLAAEDNELNAEILTELLDMVGATVDVASNGKAVVEAFERSAPGEYDAILMDVQMPVMDGYEATRAIRAGNHPMAKTITIIAMTANAFAEDVQQALDAGMNAHIPKPIEMKRLEAVLRETLHRE